jgi:hypothetical protein
MKKQTAAKLSAAILALLLIATGCSATANAPAATVSPTAAPTVAPTTAPTDTPASTAAPTTAPTDTPAATPEPTVAPTEAPAASGFQDTSKDAAFNLYNMVKLGMTKDEVDKAIGQIGKSDSPDDEKNNAFQYYDAQACGVKVTFNDQNKAYARQVIYNNTADVIGGFTSKEVTEDQSKQIKAGMSYADVVTLLGGAGIVTDETADKADCTSNILRVIDWGNKDGSYIDVEFNADNTVKTASFVPYQPE